MEKYGFIPNLSILDLLFNLVVGFVMLFIIAFLLIRPIAENKQIEQIVNKVSHPIFSETGLFEYTKIKSIIRSLKYLYNKK